MNSHFQSIEWEQTAPFLSRLWIHCVRRVLSRTPFVALCVNSPATVVRSIVGIATFRQLDWLNRVFADPALSIRRVPAAARLLRLQVRIPAFAWMSVSCSCCVLTGTCFCDGLITCPEESYRVWCAWVWSWSLDIEEARADYRLSRHWGGGDHIFYRISHLIPSLREVAKAGYLFYFASQPDKIDSAKPSLIDPQELYQWVQSSFSEFHCAVHVDDHVRNQWR
jgi:hypothetical protein